MSLFYMEDLATNTFVVVLAEDFDDARVIYLRDRYYKDIFNVRSINQILCKEEITDFDTPRTIMWMER